jgi:hypothetical protein
MYESVLKMEKLRALFVKFFLLFLKQKTTKTTQTQSTPKNTKTVFCHIITLFQTKNKKHHPKHINKESQEFSFCFILGIGGVGSGREVISFHHSIHAILVRLY